MDRRPRTLLLAGLAALLILPILPLFLHAFSTRWFYPQPLPVEWTLAPFQRLLANPVTRAALLSSIQVALAASLLSLLIGYPAARTLGLHPFRGKGLVIFFLFLPTIVPPVAMGMGLNILFLRLGLAGTLLGVILVHLVPVLPYMIFTLTGLFARYDPHYEYQAQVLGAGSLRTFFTVTLPLILPGVGVALLFAFLVSWSQYLLTLLVGGGRVITLPLLLFSAVSGGNPTTIALLALLFIGPPILAIALSARTLSHEPLNPQGGQF